MLINICKKIVLCLTVILLTLCTGRAFAFDLTECNWVYRVADPYNADSALMINIHENLSLNDSRWEEYQFNIPITLPKGSNSVFISTKLPKMIRYNNPVLFFVTENQSVRVFLDKDLIYSSGGFDFGEIVYGTRWHMITLPSNYLGCQITIQLSGDDQIALGHLDSITIDEATLQLQSIFQHDIISLIEIPLALIMIVMVLMQYLVNKNKPNSDPIFLAIFCGLYIIALVATMWTNLFLFNAPDFWHYLFLFVDFLMPLALMALAYNNLHTTMQKFMQSMIIIYSVLVLVGFSIIIFGQAGFKNIMRTQIVISDVLFITISGMLYYQGWRDNHHKHCRRLFWPILVVGLLQIIYTFTHSIPIFPDLAIPPQINILPIVIYIIWLIRHTMQEEQRLILENEELEQEVDNEKVKAVIDPLTKCFTRGKFDEAMNNAISGAENSAIPFCAMMFDIDFFKRVNDTFGHDMGDNVLVGFTSIIRSHLDARHTFIRYGGEEFIVICISYELDTAWELAEEIRKHLESTVLIENYPVTCSVGISQWHTGQKDSAAGLQKRADNALYFAKRNGRNRCVQETEITE